MLAGRISIPAPEGELEGIHRARSGAAAGVALLLHPHPLYGGTMDDRVVFRSARALEDAGLATLRFNFRGVGASSGRHDGGRGEVDDAAAALDYLLDRHPGAARILVVGYSFGAAIAIGLAARDPRPTALALIATPLRLADLEPLAHYAGRVLAVHGTADSLAPLDPLAAVLAELERPVERCWLDGADHFFADQLDALAQAVRDFALRAV